jgi:hypothetical protein
MVRTARYAYAALAWAFLAPSSWILLFLSFSGSPEA